MNEKDIVLDDSLVERTFRYSDAKTKKILFMKRSRLLRR